jgi:tagatose-1,6-bisphosphate aldolase
MDARETLRKMLAVPNLTSPEVTSEQLEIVETQVERTLRAMAACSIIDDARVYFDELHEIQTALATLFYKYSIPLSFQLHRVVVELDRIDDPAVRLRVFTRLRSGEPL